MLRTVSRGRITATFIALLVGLTVGSSLASAEPDSWVVSGVASNDRLNIRNAPLSSATIVGQLRNGALVGNLGCSLRNGARWCRISTGNIRGWVNGRFLRESDGDDFESADILDTKCKQSPRDCFRKAERKCDSQYRVISSESHAGGLISDDVPGPVKWYYLQYQCGRSGGKIANFPFRGPRVNVYIDNDFDSGNNSGSSDAVRVQDMQRYCRGEASEKFGQRPQDIATLPVENVSDGYVVYGQYPQTGINVETFQCKFNQARVFRRVSRN